MADATTTTTTDTATTTADTATTQAAAETTTQQTGTTTTTEQTAETLFSQQQATQQTQAGAEGVPEWLPEKFRVNGEDGKFDPVASAKKMADSYTSLEKMKAGAQAPAKAEDYQYTPPEEFKDALDADMSRSFRERAHKAGLSQAQYEFIMGEYFSMVPALFDGAAKLSADEARAELSKVWREPTELQANMTAAERAVSAVSPELAQQVREKYGTDPVFWQFAAQFGREVREDQPPQSRSAAAVVTDVEALMRSEAYRNPKHADHQRVSMQVRQAFEKRAGTGAVVQ